MARGKYGPNSRQVESFLKTLSGLTPQQWEQIQEAAPPAGSLPELELAFSPDYFRAADAAVKLAKSNVFPGSETACFDAMRQAHQQVSGVGQRLMPEALSEGSRESQLGFEGNPEAITELMSHEFSGESWQRAATAAMIAIGALVVRDWMPSDEFLALYRPFAAAGL